ncbi:MAG: hypothetical protein ACI4JW_07925 [Oscillospiraceae bacterium]
MKKKANTTEMNVTPDTNGASKPDTNGASKPDNKPTDTEQLDNEIKKDIENAEKAEKSAKVKNTPIKEQRNDVISELLQPSISIKDGKEVEVSVTMSDFFKRLNEANYCVTISKSLLVSAFGETNGTAIYSDLKYRAERLAYFALKYHNMKFDGKATKKALTEQKNNVFTALKDILNRLDYKANEQYKLNANTADTIAERAFNIAYSNKANIKDGYTATSVSAMGFLNFVLKLVQIDDKKFDNAKDKALSNLAKSMK